MKMLKLAKSAIGIACLFSLAACADRYFEDMTYEMYTRNFIKNFGLIDPDHDWNMAKASTVTINVGENTVPSVKVYGKYEEKYYLVANLENVKGKLNIPVDLPKSTNEIMVKLNGRKFYGILGQTINCSDLSRGVPGVTYGCEDIDGVHTDTYSATPVYEGTNGKYNIKVSHTTSGNKNATHVQSTVGSDYFISDEGQYQYFNTQQMAPIISTEPWIRYMSLNTGNWTDNAYFNSSTKAGWGLLPERGRFNIDSSVLTDWIEEKQNEGRTIFEDFAIGTNDDGGFTFFPYFYGTNYQHEMGVYLLNDDGTPVLKSGKTLAGLEAETNTVNILNDYLVSFMVFKDRDHGDLQIMPKYDSSIKRIRPKNDTQLTFEKDKEYDLGDLIEISYEESGDDWITYNKWEEVYGTQYHTRLAVHFWDLDKSYIPWITFKNYKTIETNATYSNGSGGIGIATGYALEESGHTKVIGPWGNITYKITDVASPRKTYVVTATASDGAPTLPVQDGTLTLDKGKTYTYTITSIKEDGVEKLSDLKSQLDVTHWDTDKYTITYNGNLTQPTLTIETKEAAEASENLWPKLYIGNNNWDEGTSTVVFNFHLVIEDTSTPQTITHTISENYSSWPITSGENTWDSFFEIKHPTAQRLLARMDADAVPSDIRSKFNIDGVWVQTITVQENGESVTKYLLEELVKYFQDGDSYSGHTPYSNFINWYNSLDDNKKQDSGTPTGTKYKATGIGTAGWYGGTFTEVDPQTHWDTNYAYHLPFFIEFVEQIDSSGTYDWIDNTAKTSAQTALNTYYSSLTKTQNCSQGDCNSESKTFTVKSVTLNSNAAYEDNGNTSKVLYTVVWQHSETVSPKPQRRNNAPSRVQSRAAVEYTDDQIMAMLTPSTGYKWIDASSYWTFVLPQGQDVASYPTNMPMLGRTRGYDIVIEVDDGNGGKIPYKGQLGMYLKVVGSHHSGDNNWATSDHAYSTSSHNDTSFPYVVFSNKDLNRNAQGGRSGQIASLTFKHPVTGRTFFSFEDMLVTNDTHTAIGNRNSSDRDVNDFIINITNYSEIKNRNFSISEREEFDEGFPWIWALEDLGSIDDFDFNDLVLKVTSITEYKYTYSEGEGGTQTVTGGSATKKLTFTPLCAGGTLPLYVIFHVGDNNHVDDKEYVLQPGTYNIMTDANATIDGVNKTGADLTKTDAAEIHKWFGNYHYTKMINTGSGTKVAQENIKSCVLYVDAPVYNSTTQKCEGGFVLNFFSGDNANRKGVDNKDIIDSKINYFYVEVEGNENGSSHANVGADAEKLDTEDGVYKIINTSLGSAPQSFIIMADKWLWPAERKHILDAYPQFKAWVQNKDNKTWFLPENANRTYTY